MITPRLLKKNQAAEYCGLSAATFDAVCPVRPISLGEGVRMRRYDMKKLDEWIDGLSGQQNPEISIADRLLDRLDSTNALEDKYLKILRYMRDHPECHTVDEIRGAGNHTLEVMEKKGVIVVFGHDAKGRNKWTVSKHGHKVLKDIEDYEKELSKPLA